MPGTRTSSDPCFFRNEVTTMLEKSTELIEIVWLSLVVSGTSISISVVLGVPLGVSLGLSQSRHAVWLRLICQTGMAIPPVVVGLLVYLLLSRSGPLSSWGWLFTPRAMILAQVILSLPYLVGITAGAIHAIPRELILQLSSLGASTWQVRVTLLFEARYGVLLAVAAALGRSLSEVGAVFMVGGNIQGHTRVLTTAILLETSKGEFGLALSLGAILLTLAWLINGLILYAQGSRPWW